MKSFFAKLCSKNKESLDEDLLRAVLFERTPELKGQGDKVCYFQRMPARSIDDPASYQANIHRFKLSFCYKYKTNYMGDKSFTTYPEARAILITQDSSSGIFTSDILPQKNYDSIRTLVLDILNTPGLGSYNLIGPNNNSFGKISELVQQLQPTERKSLTP